MSVPLVGVYVTLLATVIVAWLLGRPRTSLDPARRVALFTAGLAAPPVLVGLPFVASAGGAAAGFSTIGNLVAYVATAVVAIIFAGLCFVLAAEMDRRGRPLNQHAVAGALVCLSALHAFGLYLQTRLRVVVDPHGSFGDIVHRLFAAKTQIVLPTLALFGVVVALRWWPVISRTTSGWPMRGWPRMDRGNTNADLFKRAFVVTLPVLALCGLPRLGTPEHGAYLSFMGVRTPELGAAAVFIAVAVLSADRQDRLRSVAWWRDHWRTVRPYRSLLPSLVFGLAIILSVRRNDLGSIVAVTAGYTASRIVLYRELTDDQLRAGNKALTLRTHPVIRFAHFWIPGAVLAVLLVFFAASSHGKGERFDAYADPWQFPFTDTTQCVPASETNITMAELRPARPVPAGAEACVVFYGQDMSTYSQMAKSLVSIESGGLWGHGLDYSPIRQLHVPEGQSDFVISTTWSKAGALTVLLLTILLVTFGGFAAQVIPVTRTRWPERTPRQRRAALYAAAFAAAVTWQGVFVLLTNVGLLPHSGIPFPLISEGAQAAAALVAGFGLLLLLAANAGATDPEPHPAFATAPGTTPRHSWKPQAAFAALVGTARNYWTSSPTRQPDTPSPAARLLTATHFAVATTAFAILWGLAFPMAALDRAGPVQLDLQRGWSAPSVRTLATNTTPATVAVDGHTVFTQTNGRWTPANPADAVLLREFVTAYGNREGIADATLAQPPDAARRTFWDRLRPPVGTQPGRTTTLTVNSDLQQIVHDAIREPVGDVRVGTGMVVLDAHSGRLLALGSAPNPDDVAAPATFTDRLDTLNAAEHDRQNDSGYRSLQTGGRHCGGADCVSIHWQPTTSHAWIDGDPTMTTYPDLPNASQSLANRTVNRTFQPGSTFKVIVAATYLENGGSLDDLLPSPASLIVNGRDLQNVYDGYCPGTADGQLTLAQAFAVSCNTTFAILARQLGWDAIADMASRFGMPVTGRRAPDCPAPGQTHLPATDSGGIENLALGGGDIQVTPIAIASMMAAIANDGIRAGVSAISPGSSCAVQAVDADVAADLQTALRLAVTDGTLVGVTDGDSPTWAGKSGTAVLDVTHGLDRNIWLAGYVDTPDGPAAFAVVAESTGTETGRDHVRSVVGNVLERWVR